jgi:hypothetical protein
MLRKSRIGERGEEDKESEKKEDGKGKEKEQ